MSALSDNIEEFIISLLNDDGEAELQRNKLANEFGCAPSQINYVLTTRFSLQRGYAVESRRGGGGYIRVLRIPDSSDELLQAAAEMDDSLSISQAQARAMIDRFYDCNAIDRKQAVLMNAATSDHALSSLNNSVRDFIRARIMQSMALSLAMIGDE